MSTKKVTDHYDGEKHTRRIEYEKSDGSKRIIEQKVIDTPLGELGAKNTSETQVDPKGNSYTKRS